MKNFIKLSDKFILPVQLIEFFDKVPSVVTDYGKMPSCMSWQSYNEIENISFLRNWQPDSNKQILLDQLISLQQSKSIAEDCPLLRSFLNIKFNHTMLGAIKVTGKVARHIDQDRYLAITIGVTNGDSYETFIGNEDTKYRVLDGEIYLSRVDMPHWVLPINEQVDKIRYTLSYSVKLDH